MQSYSRLRWLLLVVQAATLNPSSVAQVNQEPGDSYSLVSEAVILDVVVRDNKGRLLTDLAPEDFRVFENDKAQPIRSVRLIKGGTAAKSPPGSPTADPTGSLGRVQLVSLVFEGLGNEGRRFAKEATDDFLRSNLPPNTFVGVFAVDKGLRALCPYTTDWKRVGEAAELATSGSFEEVRLRSRQLYDQLSEAAGSLGDQGTGSVKSGTELDFSVPTRNLIEVLLPMRIIEEAPALETEFPGQETVLALNSLVAAQRGLAGRKTLLFFSEGLYLPERLAYLLHRLISEANLANVSVYAVDSRGLTSQSQSQRGAQALGRAASLSQRQVESGGVASQTSDRAAGLARAQSADRGSAPVGPEEMRSLETAENSIRMNVQETLDDLSRSTGGFLTANTNDPGRALVRVVDEFQQYYEIVYIPAADLDPGYRKIRVEVDRDSVNVQTRDGYFPSAMTSDVPERSYEIPLLAALGRSDLPRDFPLSARPFRFGGKGALEQIVAAGIPFEALEFSIDEQGRRYSAHVSVLARIIEDGGGVVATMSSDYPIEGALSELEKARQGELVFLRPFELPPGRYHLEVAAYDHQARKSSAKRQVLVVASPSPGIQLSSLLLVGSLEPLSDIEKLLRSPLKHGEHRIVPYLRPEVEIPRDGEIGFYCLVFPEADEAASPDLTIAIFQDGRPLFRATPELTPASKPGELAALFSISAGQLTPGTYMLRAWAQQGDHLASESMVFNLTR